MSTTDRGKVRSPKKDPPHSAKTVQPHAETVIPKRPNDPNWLGVGSEDMPAPKNSPDETAATRKRNADKS